MQRLGALPGKLVWDREGAIAPQGRPTEPFLAFCGQLALGWVILDAGDCQAKGALERSHRFLHGNFEAGRRFANPLDFQDQLDGWSDRINARVHRTTRAVVAERLAEEHARDAAAAGGDARHPAAVGDRACRRSPICALTATITRWTRALVGRRVELRVSQAEITAVALDTGELGAATRACSPAACASPTPPTRPRSSSCAASAAAAARSTSSAGRSRATTR